MIKENIEIKSSKKKVTRICDICGEEKIVTMHSVYYSRIIRKRKQDLCVKCGTRNKYPSGYKLPIGKDSPHWKGGLSANGYQLRYTRDKNGNVIVQREHRCLYGEFLGRELLKTEKIHHIDMVKLNNNIENLFLCEDEKTHQFCHSSLEECCFYYFRKNKIWFNNKTKQYTFHQTKKKPVIIDLSFIDRKKIKNRSRNSKEKIIWFEMYYEKGFKYERLLHIIIAEKILGRKLFRDECVHHIDGNSLNNDPNNLCVMTHSRHQLCHYSLQQCTAELYKKGLVGFDKDSGKYFVKNDIVNTEDSE